MNLDRRLNLVVPFEREGGTLYVHSMPLSQDAFELYYLLLARTFNGIYTGGLGETAGPRVAALLLKDIAVKMGIWEGADGAGSALMDEVRRLSNVVAPGPAGFTVAPLAEAVTNGTLSASEVSEAESAVTFFIVASAMHRQAEQAAVRVGLTSLWGAQFSPLSCTEYAASLRT